MKLRHMLIWVPTLLLLTGSLNAESLDPEGPEPRGAPAADARYKADLAAHKDDPDMLVLPGLVANRSKERVEVQAECTGLAAGELIEFLLIDRSSGHGYEALLWSHAKPSDVHRALEFIGLARGTPYDPAQMRFWADGDRVFLSVRRKGHDPFPIERLVLDEKTDESLPEDGFIFAGSMTIEPRDGKGEELYAADVYEPRPVASIYNEPTAVLDVPRKARKGDVYGQQVVNRDYTLAPGELLTILMEPFEKDGQRRARHLALALDIPAGATGVVCRLSSADGDVLTEAPEITPLLVRLAALRGDGPPPHVALSFGSALSLPDVRKACLLAAVMESAGMAKIKPPAAGQLFYRAFIPDKTWLTVASRPTQPWELHLAQSDGTLSGRLILNEAVWSDGSATPTFTNVVFDVAGPDAVPARLAAHTAELHKVGKLLPPPVLLLYAPPGLTYGQMMEFVGPALKTHGTVYVFEESQ